MDGKHLQIKEQFDTVLGNIILANELIDEQDPSDDVRQNEVLNDVIVIIRNTEKKLEGVIGKLKHEELTNYSLVLNDDLKTTLFRYNRLKNGARPAKFTRTCILQGEKAAVVKEEAKPLP